MKAFALAVLVLGGANAVLLAVLALRRTVLARRASQRTELEERLKPLVLAFLSGEADLPSLPPREQELVADLLGTYARMVRGSSRERITREFERRGAVTREIAELGGAGASWRRAAAAARLGNIRSAAAAAPLRAALADADRDVRTAAARSLGKLADAEAVAPLLATAADRLIPDTVAAWALLQIGEPALPALRELLHGAENPRARAQAAGIVGLLGGAADAERLSAGLRDTSAEVRRACALALGRLGGPRDHDGLLAALDDRVPAVREAAASALGRLRDPRSLPKLLELAREDRFEVAQAAAHAAVAIDPAAAAAPGGGQHLAEASDLAALT